MCRHPLALALALGYLALIGVATQSAYGTEPCDVSWNIALELQGQGDYQGAANAYAAILAQCPNSQRALVMQSATSLEAGADPASTLANLDAAFQVDGFNYWAEVGLFYKVRACREAGCFNDANDALAILHARFPVSFSLARAEALDGGKGQGGGTRGSRIVQSGRSGRESSLEDEQTASELLDDAVHDDSINDTSRLAAIQDVIDSYAGTKAALRARDAKAHMLVRLDRQAEAITEFEDLLFELGEQAAASQIAESAKTRLAALYHDAGLLENAYDAFIALRDTSSNPRVRSNAALQAAGVYFETQQGVSWSGDTFDYETVRRLCNDVLALGIASDEEVARAKLMHLESHLWDKNPQQCLIEAESFIGEYREADMTPEIITARLFAGESQQILGGHEDAMRHYRWIIDNTGGEEPWEGIQTLARTHYRIFDALRRSHAHPADVRDAAQAVLTQFPGTKYADLVANAAEQGFWNP